VVARSNVRPMAAEANGQQARPTLQPSATRNAFFGGHGTIPTPVLTREELTSTPRRGPLIIEEYDATTVVPPGWQASLDGHASIELSRDEGR
jgi:N-methylhydantoinase A